MADPHGPVPLEAQRGESETLIQLLEYTHRGELATYLLAFPNSWTLVCWKKPLQAASPWSNHDTKVAASVAQRPTPERPLTVFSYTPHSYHRRQE